MKHAAAIAGRRLWNQHIARRAHRRPGELVQWLGAVQAQEFDHAKWGLALRMRDGVTESRICQIHAQAILAIRSFLEKQDAPAI